LLEVSTGGSDGVQVLGAPGWRREDVGAGGRRCEESGMGERGEISQVWVLPSCHPHFEVGMRELLDMQQYKPFTHVADER
jgi:hypothetical protein